MNKNICCKCLGGFYTKSYFDDKSKNKYCADCCLPILIDDIIDEKKNAGELRDLIRKDTYENTLVNNWNKQLGLWCSKMIECCNQLLAYNFKKAKQTMKLMVMISQKYEETASDILDKSLIVEGDYLKFVDYLFEKKKTLENIYPTLLDVLKHKKY